jgi:RNA-binding protein YlmH
VANKTELLKSITDDDTRILYARALDKAVAALKSYEPQFSDFMDPYKMGALCDIVNREYGYELNTMVWGGYADAERRTIGFFPEYAEPGTDVFPISCVRIDYNAKFSRELTHRDYLGSVLGLGINREKTGDILIDESGAYMLMATEVAHFVASGLERVGHTKVKVSVVDNFQAPVKDGTEKRLTVASLRLDAVLCGALNISRGKAAELIKGEKAFVNWAVAKSGAVTVVEGDVLTLRGTGRVILKEITGVTKKDRISVTVEIFK